MFTSAWRSGELCQKRVGTIAKGGAQHLCGNAARTGDLDHGKAETKSSISASQLERCQHGLRYELCSLQRDSVLTEQASIA